MHDSVRAMFRLGFPPKGITGALAAAGVELLPEGATFGSGVRWIVPRDRRPV